MRNFGDQQLDVDLIVKIDNFAEMMMNANLLSFSELKPQQQLLVVSLLEAIALYNTSAKHESMVYRGILSYLGRFAYYYNSHEMQTTVNQGALQPF